MNKNTSFYTVLYERRKGMGEANRQRSANAKMPNWLYPNTAEREYGIDITAIMKQFTELSSFLFTDEVLESWLDEFKADSNDLHMDGFVDELGIKIAELKALKTSIFTNNPRPVRTLISSAGFNTSDFNMKQWGKQTKRILGMDFIPTEQWEIDVINSWSENNYNLISNLSDEYIKKINNAVSDGVQFGKSVSSIKKEIRKISDNITGYRSKLIARDQVGKLNAQLTKRRMTDVGIDKYTWLTAGDERVRASHQQMSNKICRWDNNSVYSNNGKTWIGRPSSMQGLIPGEDIQCRCTAIPYMEDIYSDIDEEIRRAK